LHEEDLEFFRDSDELAETSASIVPDLGVFLVSVGHFHDAHSSTSEIEHIFLSFLQDLEGQAAWSCREIVHSSVFH